MTDTQQLLQGYSDFHQRYFHDEPILYEKLHQEGQSPKVLVVACCDSRVDPALITNAKPGDMFVLRNIANMIPPFHANIHSVGSALEYGVLHLGVEHILVLGHSECGGINALLHNSVKDSDCIDGWIAHGEPAKKRALEQHSLDCAQECCERENIILSIENLLSYPWVNRRVAEGGLQLHGWHFNIADGSIARYDPQSQAFHAIDGSTARKL